MNQNPTTMTPAHSENQIRTCETCGDKYVHEPFVWPDGTTLETANICDPCETKWREREERRMRDDAARLRWEDTVPVEYRSTDTKHPEYPKALHRQMMAWHEDKSADRKLFLGAIGESGRGKTRSVSQLVKRMIWEGASVHWINSAEFQWVCQNQFNKEAPGTSGKLRMWRKARLIVFDDIGSLKGTEAVSDNLYAILEYRSAHRLPMIWTSNERLEDMLSGDRITPTARKRNVSRLGGFSKILEL